MDLDAFAPAAAMMEALRRRQLSAVELLEMHLRRIERYNPDLNAIVIPDYDHARRAATAADAVRARGEEAPLLGLPMTIKDVIDVQWLPGTAGAPEFQDRRPKADAPVVARLRKAGAVLMGKTNVPPGASDWQTDNPLFGRTQNPWDPARTPGGSTGGGAAALAAGLTPLEFGSDISGSIRIPAAFCGVYGHKPSETALPRSGHFPGEALPNAAMAMMVLGPLARSAVDLELALDVTAGPDVGEDAAWRLELPPARHDRLQDFRVAFLPPVDWVPLEASIATAQEDLASKLRRLGLKVQVTQPEGFGDLRRHHSLFSSLLGVMTAVNRSAEERCEQAQRDCTTEFETSYCRAFAATAAEYLSWHGERELFRQAFRQFFNEWDILVTPSNLVTAFPHKDPDDENRSLQVNGQDVDYYLQLVYAGLASLSGQPATAFPAGFTASGLPIGLQAIGPYLEDRTPIRFASLLACEFGGFHPPPQFTDEGKKG